MKLVELLARELKVWADTTDCYVQDMNGDVWPFKKHPVNVGGLWSGSKGANIDQSKKADCMMSQSHATDHVTAIVTRAEWEAEVARLEMGKPEWIRHRGGKCPVDGEMLVEYRLRSGAVLEHNAGGLSWVHENNGGDIMAYRICEPEPQIDPVIVANVDAFNRQAEMFCDLLAQCPLQWRDRIREIDAEEEERNEAHRMVIEALEEERAGLVQQLEDEGFRLIGKAAQPVVDMSDWRNWKVGDIAEVISTMGFSAGKLNTGQLVAIIDIDEDDGTVKAAVGCWGDVGNNYKWHSRPSA